MRTGVLYRNLQAIKRKERENYRRQMHIAYLNILGKKKKKILNNNIP